MGKMLSRDGDFIFKQTFVKLASNKDSHKILDKFNFCVRSDYSLRSYLPLSDEKIYHLLNNDPMQVTREALKSRMSLNSGQIRLFTLKFLALKCHKTPIFDLVRSITCLVLSETMKLADNLDRHKISKKFELQPGQIIHFGVTCTIFDIVWSKACLVLIGALQKLQITISDILTLVR